MIAPDPADVLERTDWLRRSRAWHGAPRGHKEWLHFCVYGRDVDLLVNFSIVDDLSLTAEAEAEAARMTVLVRDQRGWDGVVERSADADVAARGGRTDIRIGRSRVQLRDGVYELEMECLTRPIAARLVLRPYTVPSQANNVELPGGPPINWLVCPRLLAYGTIEVDGVTHVIDGSLAYHDHNWGSFRWGQDFAWEWGFALPDDASVPWTMVFVRLSNRAHTRALMQAVFVWDGAHQTRVFRAHDVAVARHGFLGAGCPLKLPRAMALVAPESSTDVPRTLWARGTGDGDAVELEFTASDGAQVIVPNDTDAGVTIINEVNGRVSAHGVIRGRELSLEGHAIFEFLGA